MLNKLSIIDKKIKKARYTINTEKVKGIIKLAFISDLHSHLYGIDQSDLLNIIKGEDPDAVLLGGDICDERFEDENTEKLLKGIYLNYPIYMVMGNHDAAFEDKNHTENLMRKYNVNMIDNNKCYLTVNDNKICICGINDLKC